MNLKPCVIYRLPAAGRGVVGRCLIHILWDGDGRNTICGGALQHQASQRRMPACHPESFVLLNSPPNASEFIASVKITFLLNYACLCEAAAAQSKSFQEPLGCSRRCGTDNSSLFQGLCWHTTLTGRHTNTRKTHAHTHARTCERGRWQSIMGEIGSYSPALPFSLSLSPEPTARRHTCAEHVRTPTDRR